MKYFWTFWTLTWSFTNAADILVILPFPAPSHFHCFYPLIQELQNRGHRMTVVTPINVEDKRINHINLSGVEKHFFSSWAALKSTNRFSMMLSLFNVVQTFTRGSLTHSNFQNLIRSNTHFDLIMVEMYYADAYLAFSRKFNAPVIGLVPQTVPTALSWTTTNPVLFSYIPVMYLPFSNGMAFLERTLNTIFGMAHILGYEWNNLLYNQETVDREFSFLDDDAKNVRSMINDVSLILVNSHHTMGYPRPFLPNMIEVAGIHLKKLKNLPHDLQEFMDRSTKGCVYISFGTMVDPSVVVHWTQIIIEVFSKLSINVLWKWKPELIKNVPSNFLVKEWLPQNDILNHPNCKLFITHGGIHSIIESINAAVPILGLPFFSEQPYNVNIMKELGIGIPLKDIEKNELEAAATRILNDESFKENMKRRSQVFKDRLVNPMNTSIYWIEHIIRYKGGGHMKSKAMELTWYQYFLVDVFVFLLIILTILICIGFLLIKYSLILLKHVFVVLQLRCMNTKTRMTLKKVD